MKDLKGDNRIPQIDSQDEDIQSLSPVDRAYIILRRQGWNKKEISLALHMSHNYLITKERNLSKKYDLTDPKLVRLAYHALFNILHGKTWGGVDKIKDSTVLGAVSEIYSRAQPEVRREEVVTHSFCHIALDQYKNNKIIDTDINQAIGKGYCYPLALYPEDEIVRALEGECFT